MNINKNKIHMKAFISPLFILLMSLSTLTQSETPSVETKIENLLKLDREKGTDHKKIINDLVKLGQPGAWAMAAQMGSKDLYRFLTLREALEALDATASPALKHYALMEPVKRARGAMSTLAQIGHPGDIPFFLSQLNHARWDMRAQALRGMSRTEVISATVSSQISPYILDPDDVVRRYAVSALGVCGVTDSGTPLFKALFDESFFVRRCAYRGLKKLLGRTDSLGQDSIAKLIPLTQDTIPWPTRMLAIELLGEWKDGMNPLKPLLSHQDWAVRATAIRALAKKNASELRNLTSLKNETDPYVLGVLEEIKTKANINTP